MTKKFGGFIYLLYLCSVNKRKGLLIDNDYNIGVPDTEKSLQGRSERL